MCVLSGLSSALKFAVEHNTVSPVPAHNRMVFEGFLTLAEEDHLQWLTQTSATKILWEFGHTI
jgi:hypothetical protein